MNEYRLRDSGEVVTEAAYRCRFPLLSLPNVLAPLDADLVLATEPPTVPPHQIAVRAGVEQVGGAWRQKWSIAPAPLAEAIPMLNLKYALDGDGKLITAENIFNGMAGAPGALARAYWTSAQNARRDHYLVNELWPQLYPNEAAFNEAWARAAALNP